MRQKYSAGSFMNSESRGTNDRLRVIVLGYLVRGPMGGMAWHHLQYIMGLHDLGHDVYFVEDSGETPWCCYDPARGVTDADPTYGLQFATAVFARVGLGDRWVYYDAHTACWLGPCADRILNICASADLLLNLSCANPLRPWLMAIPVRTLVDTDPVFTQIRNLTDPARHNRSVQHTAFLSFAENIGLDCAGIPDDGIPWQTTRQPIVLDAWPVTPGPIHGKFTTVMQWDSYPAREHNGRRFGMKSDSFGPYLDLPYKAGPLFELAVGGRTAPRALLRARGWAVRNPLAPTRDPWTYQRYIQQSKAEFSIAKQGYVVSWSGWFSERSAAYLASGRPVLIQDTGFSQWLETGTGVIPFSTPEEALAGLEEINCRYEFHCRAARAIAAEYFDARKVLSRLIERATNPLPPLVADPAEESL
jgi:hypothetical protein